MEEINWKDVNKVFYIHILNRLFLKKWGTMVYSSKNSNELDESMEIKRDVFSSIRTLSTIWRATESKHKYLSVLKDFDHHWNIKFLNIIHYSTINLVSEYVNIWCKVFVSTTHSLKHNMEYEKTLNWSKLPMLNKWRKLLRLMKCTSKGSEK